MDPKVYDIQWAYECSNAPTVPPLGPANLFAQFVIIPPQQIWGIPGVSGGVWMPGPLYFGGVAPPGVVPPLVKAMLNGSLWTKYTNIANLLGISPGDFNLACVASHFHVPYTPVTATTTTTTTTTTSTITTTAVTTATVTSTLTSTVTTTVTSTSTAVTTAPIAGIVIIVIVIVATAAIIAMRRR